MGHNISLVASLTLALAFHASSSRADDTSRSLVLLGQAGRVEANQELDIALVIGGSLVVEGVVHGPAAAIGGDLDVRPGAFVEKGAYAVGGNLRIDEGARVQGARTQVAPGDFSEVVSQLSGKQAQHTPAVRYVWPLLRLAQALAVLLIGLVFAFLAPRPILSIRRTLEQHPSQCALAGLGLMLGFVPACVLLAISVLGIPLIAVAVVALVIAFAMGLSALAATLGAHLGLLKNSRNLAGTMALGMALLTIATAIPVLGGFVWGLASFYAAGAVLVSRFGTRTPAARPPSAPAQETPSSSELPASARH
jgi:hypothetical protein